MKKIYLSLGIIAIVAIGAIGATRAFFSDTETSTGNTFTAGAIDLKIDSEQHYNNAVCVEGKWKLNGEATIPQYPVIGDDCGGTWGQDGDGVDITNEKFFDFGDIKPGDVGENTISLHVVNNDAYVCAAVSNLTDLENGQTEPEAKVDFTTGTNDGELSSTMLWKVWRDDSSTGNATPGDNIYQDGEDILAQGNPVNGVLALYDSNTSALPGGSTTYLGVEWTLPASSGNETQTDIMTGDISFQVVQSRNNGSFVCGEVQSEPEVHQLVLENEDMSTSPNWTPITGDSIGGLLTWEGDGPTFNYNLTANGLPATTNYSLIYYADPYPGNNPGALIGTGTTDGSGVLAFSGNPDLGIDLPMPTDTNSGAPHYGAKIWLIPSANYNTSTNSVTPWAPDNTWLFEGNVYINYEDTNN